MQWFLMLLLAGTCTAMAVTPEECEIDGCACVCTCEDPCTGSPGNNNNNNNDDYNVCNAFVDADSSFMQNCRPCMDQIILNAMYEDCLANEDDATALQAFLDNIAALCLDQTGLEVTFEDGGCDCGCMDMYCYNFIEISSSFYQNCAPCMDQILLDDMYEDCLANEGDDAALEAYLENIAALCEDQTGLEVEFPPETISCNCMTTTTEPPVTEVICTCDCTCPVTTLPCTTTVPTTPVPTTTCFIGSVCEDFVRATSEFSENCAPCMDQILLDDMYDDCLANEGDTAALKAFLDNIAALCEDQTGIEIEFTGGNGCTTPTTTPTPTPTPTPIPTTSCSLSSPCDNFVVVSSQFYEDCAPCMDQILLDDMYEDCLTNEGDEAALQAFLDNIAALCEDQTGIEIEFPGGNNCIETTTDCVDYRVCDEFILAGSSFSQNCAVCMDQILLDDMYQDCLANEGDEAALQAFLDNIAALCEDQTGVEVIWGKIGPCYPTHVSTTQRDSTTPPVASTTPPPIDCERDIIFLIDGSASIGDDFGKVKDFVKEIVEHLDISVDNTRVGFIQFSEEVTVPLELGSVNEKFEVMQIAEEIDPGMSITNTHLALHELGMMIDSSGRPDVATMAILITDGKSTFGVLTIEAVNDLALGHPDLTVIVVAIDNPTASDQVDISELRLLASGFGDEHLIEVGDFDALSNVVDAVTGLACAEDAVTTPAPTCPGCQQLSVLDEDDEEWEAWFGVYEVQSDWFTCNGACIYQNTHESKWMYKMDASGTVLWIITAVFPVEDECYDDFPLSYSLSDADTPPSSGWQIYDASWVFTNYQVDCFAN